MYLIVYIKLVKSWNKMKKLVNIKYKYKFVWYKSNKTINSINAISVRYNQQINTNNQAQHSTVL
jgi:hypothetical protein